MRIAVFGDVHANLPALETFVAATRREADAYVCLGDVVDYGPWNDDCLDLIDGLPGIVRLEGNHERLFSGADPIERESPLVQAFFRRSRELFTRERAVVGLPSSAPVGDFTAVHTIGDLRIFPETPVEAPGRWFFGHTHVQFRRDDPRAVLVNPGSVGQNRRRIDLVSWAVYDAETGEVAFRERPYRVERLIAELEAKAFPPECIGYYRRKLAAVGASPARVSLPRGE